MWMEPIKCEEHLQTRETIEINVQSSINAKHEIDTYFWFLKACSMTCEGFLVIRQYLLEKQMWVVIDDRPCSLDCYLWQCVCWRTLHWNWILERNKEPTIFSTFTFKVKIIANFQKSEDLSTLANASAGFFAAFFSSFTLCPTELIKCQLQAMREVQMQSITNDSHHQTVCMASSEAVLSFFFKVYFMLTQCASLYLY